MAAEAYACYTSSNTTLTFYYDNYRSSRTGITYSMNTGENDPDWYDDGYGPSKPEITHVVFNSSFANARPTSTFSWFRNMGLESITGLYYLNTSEVTNMCAIFRNFYFRGESGEAHSLDLSTFNTSKVTDMAAMFQDCNLTSINLSSFNTAKVTTMYWMFGGSYVSSLDLSSLNTANVTDMGYMFYYTGLTSLNLSNFNTSKVKDMICMFAGCNNLSTIYAGSGWSTANVTYDNNMFDDCFSLVGGKGTSYDANHVDKAYDANHVDKAYAHIDGGPSNPGYFTAVQGYLRGDADGDGVVTIADVTSIIDYLMSGNPSAINTGAADVDFDGVVTIGDITAIIDYLLKGTWSN